MQKFKTLSDCIRLAEFAHFNQTDKAGMPYITHPMRVMKAVQEQGVMPYVQMAAILHDVTEDTAFTCAMLLDLGVPEAAVELVKLVDRDYSVRKYNEADLPDDPKHDDPSGFYYREIKKSPEATMIKLADIHDNLQEWRLSYLPPEKQIYLRDKYDKALEILR